MSFETKSGKECDLCGGEGITYWVADDHSEPCPECYGLGWIPAPGNELTPSEEKVLRESGVKTRAHQEGATIKYNVAPAPQEEPAVKVESVGQLSEPLFTMPVFDAPKRIQVLPLVLADLKARIEKGEKQYGEPLTTHNGRPALQDAYEEALDLSLYLRQAIEENAKPCTLGHVGTSGPHHTAEWMANDGPGVKVESFEQAKLKWEARFGFDLVVDWLLSLTSAQLDALRKERA